MLKKEMSDDKDPKTKPVSSKKKEGEGLEKKKDLLKKKVSIKKTRRQQKSDPLKNELSKAQEEIKNLKDQMLRSMADADNFRKRKEKEAAQQIQLAREQFLLNLLPVVDDFERSLKMSEKADVKQLREGMELIAQKLAGVLSNAGVKPMESVGKPFDVDQHDAMMQMEVEGVPAGQVVDEHARGYYLNDKVLRHAKVIISK